MKIVYCLQGLHYSGGTERITTAKANYLVSHGIDVYIITTEDNDRQSFFPLDTRVKHCDLGLNLYAHWSNSLLKNCLHIEFQTISQIAVKFAQTNHTI